MNMSRESASRPTPAFLPQIESLRGYAALCVALDHCLVALTFASLAPHSRTMRDLIAAYPVVFNGRAAVLVFFVISGFVLSLGLDGVAAHRSIPDYARFMGRRALRIYPAHIVAILLFVPFAWLTLYRIPVHDPAALQAAPNLVKAWVDDSVYGHLAPRQLVKTAFLRSSYYNPVTWTLQIEMLGSLFLPFFALLSRKGRFQRDVIILVPLILAAAFLVDPDKRPDLLPLYLPAFYLGCMVRTHGRAIASALLDRGWLRIALLLTALLLLAGPTAIAPERMFASTMSMSAGAFLLVSLVAWQCGRGALLHHAAARAMGRLSYSFYLWHALILFAFARLVFILVPAPILGAWSLFFLFVTIAVTIPVSMAIAALSWRWVERPFVEWGKRLPLLGARPEKPAAAAALSVGGAP